MSCGTCPIRYGGMGATRESKGVRPVTVVRAVGTTPTVLTIS